MKLQKNDFIEIEFTARLKDNKDVFDSNVKEHLEKFHTGHNHQIETKPLIFSLGQGMFLKGVDDFLINKEIEKFPSELKIDLSPEKAFGKRNPKLVQMIPLKVFRQHNTNPIPGATFTFDNQVAKVITVSGGRVLVDFNNPLAGKEVIYDIKILKKIDDLNEKIKSFMEFLFRKEFPFNIEGKKITITADKGFKSFVEIFNDKFKEIFDLDMEVKEEEENNKGKE